MNFSEWCKQNIGFLVASLVLSCLSLALCIILLTQQVAVLRSDFQSLEIEQQRHLRKHDYSKPLLEKEKE